MNEKRYEFSATIEAVPAKGGAYIRFPYKIKEEFGKGRVKVQVTFDGEQYCGSIVNMGVKNEDGSVCYIIGIRKDIRNQIGKQPGDTVLVTVQEIEEVKNKWQCPKCGRVFKNVNQEHYCGEAPKTIEEYILGQPEQIQPMLRQIQETIRAEIPDAVEKISWSMPTYWNKHNLIQFAVFRNHIGLYPGPEAVAVFADRLQEYRTSKGAIQLPYDRPLPLELIGDIARWCGENP